MLVENERSTRLSGPGEESDPMIGRVVDGFRIEEQIGKGGMGVVYKATQLSLNRPVAIKVLPEDVLDQPQFLERFHREVDILSRLSHPNIVTVLERGEVDGKPYVAMEFVRGTSLREVMKRGPLPRHEALSIVRDVLSALDHAHQAGVIHRDIKPENVLVAPGNIVKVADFGLSRLMAGEEKTRLTVTHLMLGTYEYMSPEQRERAKEADERSDLYALGVVLYEMLAGELPIGHFEPLSRKRPGECDSRLDAIVERSLRKEPENRYQRASEMGSAVSRLLTPPPEETGTVVKEGEWVAGEAAERVAREVVNAKPKRRPKRHGSQHARRWLPIAVVAIVGVFMVPLGLPGEAFAAIVAVTAVVLYAIPQFAKASKGIVVVLIAALLALGIMAAGSTLLLRGDNVTVVHWEEIGRVVGDLPEGFEQSVIDDADVQLWIKSTVDHTPSDFPQGVYVDRDASRVNLHIEEHPEIFDYMRQELKAAVAYAIEKRADGRFRRTVTGSSQVEQGFRDEHFPMPVVEPARIEEKIDDR
jgi:tRNA A-37 threonylcarbamoyl transferase component Bud32